MEWDFQMTSWEFANNYNNRLEIPQDKKNNEIGFPQDVINNKSSLLNYA